MTEQLPPPAAQAPASAETTEARRRPWYRHVWVPVVGALVLAFLAFGSGFVAGQGTSLFRAVTVSSGDGPAWGDGDDRGNGRGNGTPGWRDGGPGASDRAPGHHKDRNTDTDTDTDTDTE
jgi:hypothetical protein